MLRNKSKEAVTLKWNGITKTLAPGKSVNVLEFGVPPGEVCLIEQRMGSKHADKDGNSVLEVLPQPGLAAGQEALPVPEQVKKLQDQLKESAEVLEENAKEIADLQKQISEKDKTIKDLEKKVKELDKKAK